MNASLPNVVFVFADQWRAQATGFAGNPGVRTPNLDALAARSVNVTHAISGCPVCSPYRASLLTGQYPHTHGVFVNDVHLADDAGSIAKVFSHAGYSTGYIGKWHLDGRGRKNYIPPESRQGFDFWQVLECTHDYNASEYYAGNDSRMLVWDGYDAHAQTAEACRFIRARATEADPFLLFLSWGPPHAPYGTAPEEYRRLYPENDIVLRPNVPEDRAREARRDSAGYYAHCTALDDCVGRIMATIEQAGVSDETIFIFTSDHGDMLFSHGAQKKQQPYEESVRVPFLLHYPPLGTREVSLQIDAQDIMPTLLGLIGLDSPAGVQGRDMSPALRGEAMNVEDAVLLSCYVPFGQWQPKVGGREFRGLRTARYTYTRSLDGPWLLFDNHTDPFQSTNLVASEGHAHVVRELESKLDTLLARIGDPFQSADECLARWGYLVNKDRTTPTANFPSEIDLDRYRPVTYWK